MDEIDKNKQIVSQITTQLQEEYGKKGFDEKSIRYRPKGATGTQPNGNALGK